MLCELHLSLQSLCSQPSCTVACVHPCVRGSHPANMLPPRPFVNQLLHLHTMRAMDHWRHAGMHHGAGLWHRASDDECKQPACCAKHSTAATHDAESHTLPQLLSKWHDAVHVRYEWCVLHVTPCRFLLTVVCVYGAGALLSWQSTLSSFRVDSSSVRPMARHWYRSTTPLHKAGVIHVSPH